MLLNNGGSFLKSLLHLNTAYSNNAVRCLATHWDPKFRRLRAQKIVRPPLQNYDIYRQNQMTEKSKEKRRSDAIKEGLSPHIGFEYKPINMDSTASIFPELKTWKDPDPEGKDPASENWFASKGQAVLEILRTGKKKMLKDCNIDDKEEFAKVAQQLYIDAHEALARQDKAEKMLELVTEHAFERMTKGLRYKTVKWKWEDAIDQNNKPILPRFKNIETQKLNAKLEFGQVIIKLEYKEKSAVYDRFGHLFMGNPDESKEIVEYVIFEKKINGQYGTWRLHDKLDPEQSRSSLIKSFVEPLPYYHDPTISDFGESYFDAKEEEKKQLEKKAKTQKLKEASS